MANSVNNNPKLLMLNRLNTLLSLVLRIVLNNSIFNHRQHPVLNTRTGKVLA
jgi:hypothetical protein